MSSPNLPGQPQITRERRDYLVQNRDALQFDYGWQNRRSLPYVSPRPMCPDGDLCKDCEYAIHLMIWPSEEDEQNGSEDEGQESYLRSGCLGWIDRMVATQSCPFCTFIVKIFFDACPGFPKSEMVNEANRRRFCCFLQSPWGWDRNPTRQRSEQFECECGVLFQEVSDYDLPPDTFVPYKAAANIGFRLDIRSKDAVVEFVAPQHTPGAALTRLSRTIPDMWNAELFKSALEHCKAHHGEKCSGQARVLSRHSERSSVVHTPAAPLRMVDVYEMCICTPLQSQDYTALSYCWAVKPYTTLTKANVGTLAERGSLRNQELAPTISAAISVAQALGLRYLWIDSLCIVQDDPDDKLVQLRQMDDVYRTASLTLVAATSADDGSDMGLPGVEGAPSYRQRLGAVEIRGLTFRQMPGDIADALQKTRWNSRAWTFQEYYLSKRLIIFQPTQAWFVCEQATFSEDFVDHVCMDTKSEVVDNQQAFAHCCDLSSTVASQQQDGYVGGPLNYHNSYEGLVASYTTRQMSFGSDAINAVRGLINLLSREHEVKFLCGLPIPHLLGHFATWCPAGNTRRRIATTYSGQMFPSWSWAGWKGQAMYIDTSYPDPSMGEGMMADITSGEGFKADGVELNLETEVSNWKIVLERLTGGRETVSAETLDDATILAIDSCVLDFEAEVVDEFALSSKPYGRPAYLEGSVCYPILVDGTQAGATILHYPLNSSELEGKCEFIALSRSQARWMMWYPIVEEEPWHDLNYWYEDDEGNVIQHPPFDKEAWDPMGCVINVLLVHYEGNIAYRAGMAQIHANAWDASDPEMKRILLG